MFFVQGPKRMCGKESGPVNLNFSPIIFIHTVECFPLNTCYGLSLSDAAKLLKISDSHIGFNGVFVRIFY